MKRRWILMTAVAAVLGLGSVANAQSGAVYEDETVYDFDADIVEGQLVRPDGENIMGQRGRDGASLIRIRRDFIPEMVRSVEEL